ncbi:MAG: DNA methylase, partial [Erysipelotrichales bacterium]|nr:DNA methylase [Erysipelotrichales bacterium]
MEEKKRTYIAIDLKSFYASAECAKMGENPLNTNLVVADESRTDKTICLAVSPSLKSFGIPGRPRLFEVKQTVRKINLERERAYGRPLTGESYYLDELQKDPSKALAFRIAVPHMEDYMRISTKIYGIYLKYASKDDIHVYSIDEVFIDATEYLHAYDHDPHKMTMTMIRDVLQNTGITATAGIGTNLFLAKVAMDIVAKHLDPDKDGVRIAELDEMSYRKTLWAHEPITDFWRVGPGIRDRLAKHGIKTMGDIARCSVEYEEILYKEFGINAELLIDHAWGYEPCRMEDIKAYKPSNNSLGTGQVLPEGYPFEAGRLIIKEMADELTLSLVSKGLVCADYFLGVHYDIASAKDNDSNVSDWYGRKVPKPAHGIIHLKYPTASSRIVLREMTKLYNRIVNPAFLVRRVFVTAMNVKPETEADKPVYEQFDLFSDTEKEDREFEEVRAESTREREAQKAILEIQKRFGKNAVVKGMNLEKGARTKERND